MGNWCGFTPYIGAGIGFATLTVDGMKDVERSRNAVSVAYGADKTNTNFAYAFYAGASFDVTPQVGASTSPIAMPISAGAERPGHDLRRRCATSAASSLNDITSNDVMLGCATSSSAKLSSISR